MTFQGIILSQVKKSNICFKPPRLLHSTGCTICYLTNFVQTHGEMAYLKPRAKELPAWLAKDRDLPPCRGGILVLRGTSCPSSLAKPGRMVSFWLFCHCVSVICQKVLAFDGGGDPWWVKVPRHLPVAPQSTPG